MPTGSIWAKSFAAWGVSRVADALRDGLQAALGLESVYENGLVHRDIKPSNIMLARSQPRPAFASQPSATGGRLLGAGGRCPTATVKILDLGLARRPPRRAFGSARTPPQERALTSSLALGLVCDGPFQTVQSINGKVPLRPWPRWKPSAPRRPAWRPRRPAAWWRTRSPPPSRLRRNGFQVAADEVDRLVDRVGLDEDQVAGLGAAEGEFDGRVGAADLVDVPHPLALLHAAAEEADDLAFGAGRGGSGPRRGSPGRRHRPAIRPGGSCRSRGGRRPWCRRTSAAGAGTCPSPGSGPSGRRHCGRSRRSPSPPGCPAC